MDEKIKEMYQEFLCYKFKTKAEDFSYKDMCENFYRKGYRKESDTAKEILTELKNTRFHKGTLTYDFEMALNKIAEKYGVDLGE